MITYIKNQVAWFYSSKDPLFELSNMASGFPILYEEQLWKSSEALYQASKYSKLADYLPEQSKTNISNVRDRIRLANNPMASKMTQKCAVNAGLVRADWCEVNVRNMLFVLELKFNQNFKAAQILAETGTKDIVEVSKKDTFWGCREQYRSSGNVLIGENQLGRALMDIRERLDQVILGNFDEPENFFVD